MSSSSSNGSLIGSEIEATTSEREIGSSGSEIETGPGTDSSVAGVLFYSEISSIC